MLSTQPSGDSDVWKITQGLFYIWGTWGICWPFWGIC